MRPRAIHTCPVRRGHAGGAPQLAGSQRVRGGVCRDGQTEHKAAMHPSHTNGAEAGSKDDFDAQPEPHLYTVRVPATRGHGAARARGVGCVQGAADGKIALCKLEPATIRRYLSPCGTATPRHQDVYSRCRRACIILLRDRAGRDGNECGGEAGRSPQAPLRTATRACQLRQKIDGTRGGGVHMLFELTKCPLLFARAVVTVSTTSNRHTRTGSRSGALQRAAWRHGAGGHGAGAVHCVACIVHACARPPGKTNTRRSNAT